MTDRSVAVELRLKAAQYLTGLSAVRKATRDVATDLTKATKENHRNMERLGRSGLVAGGALAAGVGVAVKRFAEFDQRLSSVRAATHGTAKEMDALKQAALDAGAATVFSASDAADAETELAKAGVSVSNILGGALTGSLSLAAAGQLEVANAAEIAATTMTQFGLKGNEVGHIADVLAAGAGKAQGEVTDMALALKYAGVPSAALGVSLEETAGTIALFAKNGIIGEQSGTSLRSMLGSLTAPSAKAADTMKSLGIEVFDAQGNFKGFRGVAAELNTALADQTQAQRSAALGIIFGNEAMQAANILTAKGADAVDNWTGKVNDQGFAAETAATKLDNLTGDLEALRGSIDTALIQSGSGANDALRGIAQTATGAVNAFSGLPAPVQQTGFAVGAVAASALLAAGAAGSLIPKVRETRDALNDMGRAGQFADRNLGRLGRLAGYGTLIAAVGIGVGFLGDKISQLEGDGPPKIDALAASLVKLGNSGREIGDLNVDQIVDDLGQLSGIDSKINKAASNTSFGLIGRDFDEAKGRIDALDDSLSSLVGQGYGAQAAEIFERLTGRVRAAGGDVGQLKGRLDGYAEATKNAAAQESLAGDNATGLSGALGEVQTASEDAATALESYKTALEDTVEIDAFTAVAELAKSFKDLKGELSGGDAASAKEIRVAELRLKGARDALAAGKATASERASVLEAEQRLADLRAQGGDSKGVTNDDKIALGGFAREVKSAASAILDQTGSQKKANEAAREGRRQFIKLAEEAGYTAEQARRLGRRLIEIPSRTDVSIDASSVDDADRKVRALARRLHRLNGTDVAVTVGAYNRAQGLGLAAGGFIPGPPSRSDTVPAWLSTGEYVVNSAATAANRGLLDAINSGQMARFADGGYVRGSGATSSSSGASFSMPTTIVAPDPISAGQAVSRQIQNDLWASGMLS